MKNYKDRDVERVFKEEYKGYTIYYSTDNNKWNVSESDLSPEESFDSLLECREYINSAEEHNFKSFLAYALINYYVYEGKVTSVHTLDNNYYWFSFVGTDNYEAGRQLVHRHYIIKLSPESIKLYESMQEQEKLMIMKKREHEAIRKKNVKSMLRLHGDIHGN